MAAYLTLSGCGEAELTERGSRFIGVCKPLSLEESAKEFIASARSANPGAAHNVFAYRLRDGISRQSDDGEPSGTAGAPVFDILAKRDIYDAVIVVTRYFGGTLLGAGGLVRAYSRTAAMAVEAAGTSEMRPWNEGTVTLPYSLYEQASRLLDSFHAAEITPDFGADVLLRFLLPAEEWDTASDALLEMSSGAAKPERGDLRYRGGV